MENGKESKKISIKNSQIDTYPTLPYATLLPLIIDQYSSLSIIHNYN